MRFDQDGRIRHISEAKITVSKGTVALITAM